MLGIALEVGVKTTMTFDAEDGSEVKLPSLKRFFTAPMGAMGVGRQSRCKGTQQQSQEQKARAKHETQQKKLERKECKQHQRIDTHRALRPFAPA